MKKLLALLVFAAATVLPFAAFAANPAPPTATYGNMHTRCGFSDGAVLTTAELDCSFNDSVQQDGSGNAQELNSLRVGNRGFLTSFTTNGATWLLQNAYTLDGTSFYPFSESLASLAIKIQTDGITINYSPALNADGAITWTVVTTFGASTLTGPDGGIWSSVGIGTGAHTVAGLGTCNSGNKGVRSFVTDATATTFMSTVVGGGSTNVPVVCSGSAWVIG